MYSTLISVNELKKSIKQSNYLVFDCRFDLANPKAGETLYQQNHLHNARYAHLEKHLSGDKTHTSGRHPLPDEQLFIAWLRAQGVNADSQVVVYDQQNGAFAARLWWLLHCWLGHEQAAVLDGGYQAWCAADLPVSSESASSASGNFIATANSDRYINTSQVLAAASQGCLVDARSTERFIGAKEPIDPVAGHIPGAINHDFNQNLTDGHFIGKADLAKAWAGRLGDMQAEKVIHMCGSGVTACHNILAMEHAGLVGAKLYPGSWSEWVTDAGRPVAKGHS